MLPTCTILQESPIFFFSRSLTLLLLSDNLHLHLGRDASSVTCAGAWRWVMIKIGPCLPLHAVAVCRASFAPAAFLSQADRHRPGARTAALAVPDVRLVLRYVREISRSGGVGSQSHSPSRSRCPHQVDDIRAACCVCCSTTQTERRCSQPTPAH